MIQNFYHLFAFSEWFCFERQYGSYTHLSTTCALIGGERKDNSVSIHKEETIARANPGTFSEPLVMFANLLLFALLVFSSANGKFANVPNSWDLQMMGKTYEVKTTQIPCESLEILMRQTGTVWSKKAGGLVRGVYGTNPPPREQTDTSKTLPSRNFVCGW